MILSFFSIGIIISWVHRPVSKYFALEIYYALNIIEFALHVYETEVEQKRREKNVIAKSWPFQPFFPSLYIIIWK